MSVLDEVPPRVDQRINYGSNRLQFVELRFPNSAKPWPVVFNIHGGFWRARHSLDHAGHLCAALTHAGFATCNVEYRRVGDEGGGWPGSLEDVRAAYKWLQEQGKGFGCDLERLVVMGHSAGGQLAICLGAYEPDVRLVVSLAGVLDLKRAYELHLSDDAVVEFLHGTPQQVPEHYWKASPMNLKVNACQAIIVGTADTTVPPELSRSYVDEKREIGEKVKLVEIAGADHLDLIDPRASIFAKVIGAIQNLMA